MGNGTIHPLFHDVRRRYANGSLSRREFLQLGTALGLSAGAMALGGGVLAPQPAAAAAVQRGGTLKIAMVVLRIKHPAQATWSPDSNLIATVAEYLTEVKPDGSVVPVLLESWSPSADLMTWTLNVRRGVTFNNGDELTADDVVFTMRQWLDPGVQSSMINYLGPYLSPNDIEKVSSHQVRLHLSKPRFAVPIHLAEFPANILNHRTFEGDFIKAPHGTGPFVIDTYRPGEVCSVKARPGYWNAGADGKPLPYLDGITFVDMGYDITPQIAALKNGEVHLINMAGAEVVEACRKDPNFNVTTVATADTAVLRMRTDLAPWSDNRVRQAFKACQNREKIVALAIANEGIQGHDCHVYPGHPAYCEKPIPAYDPEKSRALLKAAGHPKGLKVTLNVHADSYSQIRYAEVLKEDCAAGGFKVTLNPTPEYWDKWTEYDLGITHWIHNPIATTYLNVGYGVDQEGKPLPWNETRWVDKEFHDLLDQASGLIDVEARRKVMCRLEQVMMDRGGIGIAFWMNKWWIVPKKVHGVVKRPDYSFVLDKVWLET